jgi:hypothetical protein
MMLLLMIAVPVLVAGGISFLLVRREAALSAGSAAKHQPRAAGFGQGGRPVPVDGSGDAGLKSLLEPDYWRPGWLRALRVLVLAVIVAVAGTAIAAGIFFLLRILAQAFVDYVTGG